MTCRHRRRRTVFSQGAFWLLLGIILAVSWLLAVISG
jgi:hypothetical protein